MYMPVSREMAAQIALDEKIRKGLISAEDAEIHQQVLNNRKNARKQLNKYCPKTKPSEIQQERDRIARLAVSLNDD